MEREFVSYTEALELKEIGFDEPCMFVHDTWGNIINWTEDGRDEHKNSNINASIYYSAPLYQQAFRWFREKHGLYCGFNEPNSIMIRLEHNNFETIKKDSDEEAELECLKKLIEIVESKKE